jgi:hypothetical protein
MTAVCGTFNPEQLLVVYAAGNKTEFHTIIDEAVAKNASPSSDVLCAVANCAESLTLSNVAGQASPKPSQPPNLLAFWGQCDAW